MLLALSQSLFRRIYFRPTGFQQILVRHSSLDSQDRLRIAARGGGTYRPLQKFTDLDKVEFVGGPRFVEWLTGELASQAQATEDPGYARYLTDVRKTCEPSRDVKKARKVVGIPKSLPDNVVTEPLLTKSHEHLLASLKAAYKTGGEDAVESQLKYAYYTHQLNKTFSKKTLASQQDLADLRYPAEWFPLTRYMQRKIHLHVGPTNSGKTYHALQRLEEAKSGVYAGPLRLLAHEIFTRMNAKGVKCDLVTGDERIQIEQQPNAPTKLRSCTVEMIPLGTELDVAVIDEIQMMGDESRGWAWTQALLGVKAKEIHLCGEERTVPLIREMVASMGDDLEVHNYERLSPLTVMHSSLGGSFQKLRKGDCVVVFSRIGIHAMKKGIEKATKRRVAIIYGTLPPEIRAQQARLFNDPDNDYDVLVASDAIGMGLNLAIKRIVFDTVTKFNGSQNVKLQDAQIKQIGGRAGRYRTAAQAESQVHVDSLPPQEMENVGLVTTLDDADLPIVRKAMASRMAPMMSARIFPPERILTKFAAYFPPSTSFSYIMQRLHEIALLHPRYQLCQIRDQSGIADVIQGVKSLSLKDRITFCAGPCASRDKDLHRFLVALARCVGDRLSGSLLDIRELDLTILDEMVSTEEKFLQRLESLHKSLILYLWLSYRFPIIFASRQLAFYIKRLVEEKIDNLLANFSASADIQRKIQNIRERARRRLQKSQIDEAEGGPGLQESREASLTEDEVEVPPQLLLPESKQTPTPVLGPDNELSNDESVMPEQDYLQRPQTQPGVAAA